MLLSETQTNHILGVPNYYTKYLFANDLNIISNGNVEKLYDIIFTNTSNACRLRKNILQNYQIEVEEQLVYLYLLTLCLSLNKDFAT